MQALGDKFMICPNVIGAAFSVISLVISFIIPHSSSSSISKGGGDSGAATAAVDSELAPINGCKGRGKLSPAEATAVEGSDVEYNGLRDNHQV